MKNKSMKFGKDITLIDNRSKFWGREGKIEISWFSSGSTPISETEKFLNNLKKAIKKGKDWQKNPTAVILGSIKSDKKAKSSRLNGKKGGRPITK